MEQPVDTIIAGARIFTGYELIEKGYVTLAGGKISKVGKGEFIGDAAQAVVISATGDTLMPGLIDSHIHALGGNIHSIEQSLRFGVTTVCDMHNDPRDNEKLLSVSLFSERPVKRCN